METFGGDFQHKYFGPKYGGIHFHEMEGVTELSDRHDHEFYGRTLKTIGRGLAHYHIFEGITSFDDGHEHIVTTKTSSAVLTENFRHTHRIEGKTSINSRHNHVFKGNLTRW